MRELRVDAPSALAALVMRCLEKDAEARPGSADEILKSLEAIVTPSGAMSTNVAQAMARRARWRKPAVGLAVAIAAIAIALFASKGIGGSSAESDKSIAVMPLTNLSGDSTNNYFGEGLAEEITSALAKAGLHVIGRGSARALAARGLDVREVASQLGVGTVLQGNVQRSGDQVRISVTLMSGADGSVRWTEKYDRQLKDIFAVQDEIARSIVTELRATLSGGTGATIVRTETSDPEAHSLYLQGLYLWNRRTGPAIHQAIGLFEQAVARDPKYARAHAGIALAYTVLTHYEDGNADSLTERGRTAAIRALELDSTLAEAWTARAYGNTQRFNNAQAASEFQRAVQYDSTFATARFWHGLLLARVGRTDDALRELDAGIRLEPTALTIRAGRAQVLMGARRVEEALAAVRSALALDSTYALARYGLGLLLAESGRHDEAIRVLRGVVGVPGVRRSEVSGALAWALARGSHTVEARDVVAATRRTFGGGIVPSGAMAAALFELGDRDGAFAALEAAVRQHDPWLIPNGRGPRYDKLRADPRGKALLESMERP